MSTTFKRIALVAVAALGLGVVSVAPSFAATPSASALKISDATVYGFAGDTITANITLTATAAAALTAGDSYTVSATVVKPTNASALTQDSSTATTSYNPSAGHWGMIDTVSASTWTPSVIAGGNNFKLTGASSTETNTAKVVGKLAFAPVTPGTYTFTVSIDSATAAAEAGNIAYTAGTITMKVLSVGASSGDGAVASPYNTLNGVAGTYNYVTVKATGRDGASALTTQVVVSGSTFISTDITGATLSTDKTVLTIPGTTNGSPKSGSVLVATPAVGTVTVNTYVESSVGQYAASADSTVTITVRATALNGVYSYADVYAASGSSTPDEDTDAVVTVAATAPKAAATVSSTPVANLIVSQYDALDNALSSSKTTAIVAQITGAGVLGTSSSSPSSSYIAVAAGSATTAQANDQRFYIFPDGRTGVGTVTITVNGVLKKTFTVNFYGTVASYKQDADNSPSKTYIGVGETGTISVFSYDAGNVKISSTPTVYATSDTTTVATVSAAASTNGVIVVTGVAAGKSNINICNTASCTAATAKLVVPVEITKVSAKEGGVTLSFDKTSYEPGEKMVLTVTAVDSNDRPVADGARALFSSTGVTANVSFGGASVALPTSSVTLAGGTATYTLYAPSAAGAVTITGTEGAAVALTERAAAATAGATYTAKKATATVTVTNAAVDAATDAAMEATAAAQDAADAAYSAADAADQATTAAQNAVEAVADLSAKVDEMIKGLQSQIKSLAALVAKIAKKVKA